MSNVSFTNTHMQFFHVPVMERCFYFGDSLFEAETQQLEITQEIVKHTRCNVKMTWTKDCGLTFMIYGKSTVTMQAQRIILSKLQPQVCYPLNWNVHVYVYLTEVNDHPQAIAATKATLCLLSNLPLVLFHLGLDGSENS